MSYFYNEQDYGEYVKIQTEKRKIARAAIAIGLACIAVFGITELWTVPYLFIMSFFGFTLERSLAILRNEPIYLQLAQIFLSVLCFTVPFIIITKVRNQRLSDIIPFNRPKKGTVKSAIFLGIGFCAFADAAVNIAGTFFENLGFNYTVPQTEDPSGILGFIVVFTVTSAVPALVEEFAFRGVVLGILKPFGNAFAVIISALLFGIMHGNFEQIPFAFTIGLALGFIRIKTDSMTICIFIHFLNNAVSVLLSYIAKTCMVGTETAIYGAYLLVGLVLGVIGVLLLPKEEKENKTSPYPEKKKYIWFLTNPAIIVFLALNVLSSLQFFG